MILPKFLIADNDDFPENTYIVHTENPRFIMDADSEEYEILDGTKVDHSLIDELIGEALDFYEAELERYDEEDDL